MTRAEAIEIIEDAQRIHQEWADWQRDDPTWRDHVTPDSPGGESHHRDWVQKYAGILEVLRSDD